MAFDPTTDDSVLLVLARTDDRAAALLFGRYKPIVKNHLRRRLRNSDVVDELVQDTLVAFFEKVKSGVEMESARGYLYGIANNKYCAYLRSIGRLEEDDDLESLPDLDSMISVIAGSRDGRLLAHALHALKPEQQTLLYYFYWLDMSRDNIATVMGTIESTVGSRLYTARRALLKEYRAVEARMRQLHDTSRAIYKWSRKVSDRTQLVIAADEQVEAALVERFGRLIVNMASNHFGQHASGRRRDDRIELLVPVDDVLGWVHGVLFDTVESEANADERSLRALANELANRGGCCDVLEQFNLVMPVVLVSVCTLT